MDTIRQIVLQESNERRYARKHIDGYIREAIKSNPDTAKRMVDGIQMVEAYMAKSYYDSKNARIAQLTGLDLEELVLDIFTGIAYCQQEELFTSVTAQLASRLKFDDKKDAITTVAELVAVLCATDAYDINKASKGSSLVVVSRIPLGDELLEYINNSQYLPPMVCEPLELESNYSCGYLSYSDGLILGKGNMHSGDICLDVLNLVNKVCLRLDVELLGTVEEDPSKEYTIEWAHRKASERGKSLNDAQAQEAVDKAIANWMRFKKQCYAFYTLIADQGNEFYLTHKVDKRGRLYASGYHITTQGTSFKKASIELANEEVVEGVP